MTSRPDRLDVFLGESLVGQIQDSAPLSFAYAPEWLARPERTGIATISLREGWQSGAEVQAFFENLLPEGELRQYIAQQKKASTFFSLLFEVAGDTAGGFVILPAGQRPSAPSYRKTSWEALAASLSAQSAAAIDLKEEGARISLAGAQDKTSIALFDDGVVRLPQGAAPSTHILKPNIRRLNKVWHSAANEAIVMLTAARCGLPTAEAFYEPHTQSCVVRRFDRVLQSEGSLSRLIQYDLCQLAGVMSEKKYEKEGGPGIAACAALIRQFSTQPAVDLRHLLRWIFFNLYVGNNDSHAKNLSMYRLAGRGATLTPFYDLMCTRLYPGLSTEFAFSIGGQTQPGALLPEHVAALADALGMQAGFVRREGAALAKKIPEALEQAIQVVMPQLPHAAKDLAERLSLFVLSTTQKTVARLKLD